jgi:iron complex transport system substrate-binding protein
VTAGVLVTTLVAAVLIGVIPASRPARAQVSAFPVTIHDAGGRLVRIAVAPRRVISLAPSVTEILLAIGLDAELVGISDADDYPPERIAGRPRVGGVVVNVENVMALQPDLVVGVHSLQRDQLERLARVGLSVLAVDATSLEGTLAQIRVLGLAMGRQTQAKHLAAGLERRAASVQPGASREVYIEVWHEPVTAAGGGTLIDDLLRRAGGVNIFGRLPGYPQVAAEQVVARSPHVILMIYPGRAQLMRRAGWATVAAVRGGRVYEVPASLVTRPGPRAVEGLELVARLLRAVP